MRWFSVPISKQTHAEEFDESCQRNGYDQCQTSSGQGNCQPGGDHLDLHSLEKGLERLPFADEASLGRHGGETHHCKGRANENNNCQRKSQRRWNWGVPAQQLWNQLHSNGGDNHSGCKMLHEAANAVALLKEDGVSGSNERCRHRKQPIEDSVQALTPFVSRRCSTHL